MSVAASGKQSETGVSELPLPALDFAVERKKLWPVIRHIRDIREALVDAGAAFSETEQTDHIIFNYKMGQADTFPDPNAAADAKTAVMYQRRRECRGLIFCKTTGRVLARRFHKYVFSS